MLNFVICDDNLNILNKLSKMLESIFTKYNYDAEVVFQSDNIEEILKYVTNNKTDVLMLDINLKSDKTGLELAESVRKKNKDIYIIFTTGHLEYAMMAYKFKTFDYLAKPITLERLEETITRLFDDINGLPRKYITIDNKNTIIDESEIEYIQRDGMKIIFRTITRSYETYSSFNKLKDILPENFIRCHKSVIANIDNILNVDFVSNEIYFKKNGPCSIGPKYKNELKERLKKNGFIK